MDSIDIVELIITQYGTGGAVALFLTLKGIASVVANNFHTEEMGKVGKAIDWLASNNKKAKLTGEPDIDVKVMETVKEAAPKKIIGKVINFLS